MTDSVKVVVDIHEARAGKMHDVIGEAKVLATCRPIRCEQTSFFDSCQGLREIDGSRIPLSYSRRQLSIIQF